MALVSRPAQLRGQAALARFAYLNPLGANLANAYILGLLAIQYGASDFQTGLIYAGVHLSNIFLLFAPLFVGGRDASVSFARAWLSRAVLSLAYLSLPFLPGNEWKIWVLVGTFLGWLFLRAIGNTAQQAVIKAMCRPDEVTAVAARQSFGWHLGTLAISVVVAIILGQSHRFPNQEWAFVAVLSLGVVLNFATSLGLRALPPGGVLPYGSPVGVLAAIPPLLRDRRRREVVFLTLLTVPMGLAAAYQLNHYRVVLGLAADHVFLITLAGSVAMIAGSKLAGVTGRAVGFRPLQLGAHATLAVCGLGLAFNELVPSPARLPVAIGLYLVAQLCLVGSGTLLAALAIDRLPEHARLETNIIFQLTATVGAALGLGALALLQPPDGAHLPGGHAYTHAFLLWTACSLALCLFNLGLRRPGAAVWDEVALLRPGNILSALRLQNLERDRSTAPLARLHQLEGELSARNAVSRRRLLELLRSPDPRDRRVALRSLFLDPLPEALPHVLAEALNPASPQRLDAITALGFLPPGDHLPVLRQLAADADPHVAAYSIKSLCRLGHPPSTDELLARWRDTPAGFDRQQLLTGLAAAKAADTLDNLLRHELASGAPAASLQPLLLACAELHDERRELTNIFSAEMKRAGQGLDYVLAELADHPTLALLASRDPDSSVWRARVAASLQLPPAPDDITAAALLFLALRRNARPSPAP